MNVGQDLAYSEISLRGQRDRTDLVLDRVGVQFEGAVLEEADQAGPVGQRVTDVLGQPGFLRDPGELGFQRRLEPDDLMPWKLAESLTHHVMGDGSALKGYCEPCC